MPISVAAHFAFPVEQVFLSSWRYLGVLLILAGVVQNLLASAELRNKQTPVEFNETPTQLVTTGPFRHSRNPIYLGGLIVLVGMALLLGSLVTFFFPALLFLLLNFIYIPSEEKEMERIFGMEYIEYTRKVRRWL